MAKAISLKDSEYKHLAANLDNAASTQMLDRELASFFRYHEEDFQKILEAYPEFRAQIKRGRIRGQADLRVQLWNKAIGEKSLEALKYLAAEYLNIGQEKKEDPLEALEVSAETLKKIHDLLTH